MREEVAGWYGVPLLPEYPSEHQLRNYLVQMEAKRAPEKVDRSGNRAWKTQFRQSKSKTPQKEDKSSPLIAVLQGRPWLAEAATIRGA